MPASDRFTTSRSRNRWCGWVLFFAVLAPVDAHADAAPEVFSPRVWISPGIYSQHFDSSKHLRNDNPGLSVEVALTSDHALIGGSYINSNRARTHYGAYEWRPLHWQVAGLDVGAGDALGAFDGYPKSPRFGTGSTEPWQFRSNYGSGKRLQRDLEGHPPGAVGVAARNFL